MDDGKVWTCQAIICSEVIPSGLQYCDLIFVKGDPFLVLDWISTDGGNEEPGATIGLEKRFLTKLEPPFEADFLYDHSVVDARKSTNGEVIPFVRK